ncbi:MAG: type I restriction endonuclease, partial [Gemmatimonadetes bacterium]|nr:type I restriction endonuclease [Gemmatimonadota bacterium]
MIRLLESTVEDAALDWLENCGWQIAHGPNRAPDTLNAERADYGEVVLQRRLRDALEQLNPDVPVETLDDAFRRLTRPEGATLEARNRSFHRLVVNGVTVEYRTDDGAIRGTQVRIIDFDNPSNNDWLAVNQFTVVENKHERRPDVVLFVNGLPLGLIELKNPADEDATVWTAWQQLQTYKAELPGLFTFNAALIVSDGIEARIGTLTAGREWFKPWRTITGETLAEPNLPQLQVMLGGVCDPHRFLALVRDFIVFEDDGGGTLVKKMAGYHQFHAVNTAVAETLRAT